MKSVNSVNRCGKPRTAWEIPPAIYRLMEYESRGYEPEEIPLRHTFREFDFVIRLEAVFNEPLSEKSATLAKIIQGIYEDSYHIGYADGVKATRGGGGTV